MCTSLPDSAPSNNVELVWDLLSIDTLKSLVERYPDFRRRTGIARRRPNQPVNANENFAAYYCWTIHMPPFPINKAINKE